MVVGGGGGGGAGGGDSGSGNPDWFTCLVPAYPGCRRKEAVKRV